MEKTYNEDETSKNENEDLSSNVSEESNKNEFSSNDLSKELENIKNINKQLYERAKKAELKYKEIEARAFAKKDNDNNTKEPDGTSKENHSGFDTFEMLKLFSTLKNYSDEEIELIRKQAKVLNVDIAEAVKDEDLNLLIEFKREKLKKEQANIKPNSRQSGDKSFENWTDEDIIKLSSNPTKENIQKLDEYRRWHRTK